MAKEPTAQPTVWGLLGIVAACFFGVLSLYHAVFWLWQAVAYHADKGKAWSHLAMWLVLGAGAAFVWCRLLWLMYFPKKKL